MRRTTSGNGFDVVAIRVKHERGIVARVVGARAWLAVIGAACGDGSGVEVAYGLLTVRTKSDMCWDRPLGWIFHRRNIEVGTWGTIIDAEPDGRLVMGFGNVAEWRQGLCVERDAAFRVRGVERDVVEHASTLVPVYETGWNLAIPASSSWCRVPSNAADTPVHSRRTRASARRTERRRTKVRRVPSNAANAPSFDYKDGSGGRKPTGLPLIPPRALIC